MFHLPIHPLVKRTLKHFLIIYDKESSCQKDFMHRISKSLSLMPGTVWAFLLQYDSVLFDY